MKGRSKGFTLVELMIAALLAGITLIIALPLVLIGRNADARTEKNEAIALAGEAIFEYVADEMKFAGRLYIGDLTDKRPVGEDWKSITASEKGETEIYSRLLYHPARELTDETPDAGTPLYENGYQEKTDLVIEAQASGRNQLRLTVKLMDGEEALYEKTAVISLLNLTLNATNQVEGYVGGEKTTAPEEGETPLVLWYQSSKNTVNPFDDTLIDGSGEVILPGAGPEVVSLASPQYVKIGETLEVQFKAQEKSGWRIKGYNWELINHDDPVDHDYYVKMLTGQEEKSCTLKGLSVTGDESHVQLRLTVYFVEEATGNETSDFDTCDIIVYDGYKPGEVPVEGFVIVPDGQEEKYIQEDMAAVPIWIKKGTEKNIYLVAVDENRKLTEYSPENWRDASNSSSKNYIGFRNDEQSGTYVYLDDTNSLTSGSSVDEVTNRNFVGASAKNMDTQHDPQLNYTKLAFGRASNTGYLMPDHTLIKVESRRLINIYDAKASCRYGIDTNTTDKKAEPGKPIKVAVENESIDLELFLNVDTNLNASTNLDGKPEMDMDTIYWTLNNGTPFSGEDMERFSIKKNTELKYPQLRTGRNTIQYNFYDTAGERYEGEILIDVPTEVESVKFDQDDSIYLLKLDSSIVVPGVTTRDISFTLYNKDGEQLGRDLIDEFTIEWRVDSVDQAFQVTSESSDLSTPAVTAKKEGTGTLNLILTEKIPSEGYLPRKYECECIVNVLPMVMDLELVFGENGKVISRQTVVSGTKFYLTDLLEKSLIGVGTKISLPPQLQGLESKLQEINWDKVSWQLEDKAEFFSVNTGTVTDRLTNDYLGEFSSKGSSGELVFTATAQADSDLFGTIPIMVGSENVNIIKIWDSNGKNKGTLKIGENESITLLLEMHSKGNRPFDPNVIWEIVSGKRLLDLEAGRIVQGQPVDYNDESKNPRLVLRKDLTSADRGEKIIIRATALGGAGEQTAEYTITVQ